MILPCRWSAPQLGRAACREEARLTPARLRRLQLLTAGGAWRLCFCCPQSSRTLWGCLLPRPARPDRRLWAQKSGRQPGLVSESKRGRWAHHRKM